jgi:long-subunit fatty acid transport protein
MGVRGKLLVLGISIVLLLAGGVKSSLASSLNGTNIWGIGSVASQMGGTGTAMPLEALTATLRNPAGTAFLDQTTINFDMTILNTNFHDKFDFGGGVSGEQCDEREYPLPNIGIVLPLKSKEGYEDSPLSFGVGLGVSAGGGDNWNEHWALPLELSALYEVFSAVANVTYKITDELALGAGPRLNWGLLDLGHGHRLDPSFGGQVGLIYAKPCWSLGVTYISTTTCHFDKVYDFGLEGDGLDRLRIQEPNQVHAGFSWHPNKSWVLNLEGKWLGYDGCDLYEEIGWKDLWTVNVGAQYQLLPCLKIRAGYQHNNSVLKDWDGEWNPGGSRNLQGVQASDLVLEVIRMYAIPLYWTNHVGGGIGWDLLPGITVNVGGTYSFEFTEEEWSVGNAVQAGVKSSFWTLDAGLELRF